MSNYFSANDVSLIGKKTSERQGKKVRAMTVLFSELQLPGWAESGEKIGLSDVTFTYDDAKAFTLPCHTSDPEIFFADDQLALAAADWNQCVNGLDAGLHWCGHRLAADNARSDALNWARLLRVDWALAVEWSTEWVNNTSETNISLQ